MERLTKRDADRQAMMDCQKCKADWTGKHGKPMDDCTAGNCGNAELYSAHIGGITWTKSN